jgi:tetratricopeptide (TPR) repeat protein
MSSHAHATKPDPFAPARDALSAQLARIEADPRDADAWTAAAEAMLQLGQRDDAIHALRQAAAIRPDPRVCVRLGSLLASKGVRDEPEAWYRRAVRCGPDYVEGWLMLGYRRLAQADTAQAGECFAQALTLDPSNAEAAAGAAQVLDRKGHRKDAWRVLQEAISKGRISPRLALAAASVGAHTGHEEEALVVVRQALRKAEGTDLALLHHAKGDLCDRVGRHDRAWRAWTAGNAARQLSFDTDAHAHAIDAIIHATAQLPEPSGPVDERPVFVVGMPRSGTTLVERILAAHPSVHGAGELEALRDTSFALARQTGGRTWLDAVPDLDVWSQVVGRTYLKALDRHAPADALRVVDKMPNNALHLGLAAASLPGARFVWCVRDDDDTALSCFSKPLPAGLPWATSVSGIRAWQQGLHRLHAHWQKVVQQPILTVRYEDLVRDPEAGSRALMQFVGLPWDPAVLDFHRHTSSVKTSSWDQVREPMHTGRIDRSAPYRQFLSGEVTTLQR